MEEVFSLVLKITGSGLKSVKSDCTNKAITVMLYHKNYLN